MIPQFKAENKICVMKFCQYFLWVKLNYRIFRDSLLKYIFLCVSHKLLYFADKKSCFDKQTYAICRMHYCQIITFN